MSTLLTTVFRSPVTVWWYPNKQVAATDAAMQLPGHQSPRFVGTQANQHYIAAAAAPAADSVHLRTDCPSSNKRATSRNSMRLQYICVLYNAALSEPCLAECASKMHGVLDGASTCNNTCSDHAASQPQFQHALLLIMRSDANVPTSVFHRNQSKRLPDDEYKSIVGDAEQLPMLSRQQ
jgi:hypothetical protein